MPDKVGHDWLLMGNALILFLMLRVALLNFFQRNARNGGNFFVGQFGFFKHGVDHFKLSFRFPFDFSFCSPFFFAFVKVKFVSHILAPYESIIFVKRYLVVYCSGLMGVRILGRKVFHVSLDDRIGKFLVPCEYIKIFKNEAA